MNSDSWIFFKDDQGEWRWKRIAPNGEIVGAASEGYKNKLDVLANAERNGWTEDQPTEWEAQHDD